MFYSKKIKILLIFAHLLIGVLLANLPTIGIIVSSTLFILAFFHVIITHNKNNQALFWSIYFVSFEVLFRMSKALYFYESIKYWVIILLFTGMVVERRKQQIHFFYIFYLLVLIFSITYAQIPYDVNFRKAILFNLSGPFVLAFSAFYSYNRKISFTQIIHLLYIGGLPFISMLTYLFFKTPNFREINFTTSANHITSGGFGPNQVATALGFGIFIYAVLLIVNFRFTGYKNLDFALLLYITYRGILTFSRGGIWTGFIAVLLFTYFYLKSKNLLLKTGLKYAWISIIVGIFVWQYAVDITGGMIANRYLGKNVRGVQKEDITTGRLKIIESEMQIFFNNPVLGVGAGAVMHVRKKLFPDLIAATHSEIGRLMAEHGIFGIISLFGLMIIPVKRLLRFSLLNKAFLWSFYFFWFLTINHSAMRVSFPGFIYGLSLIIITNYEKNTIYRK